MSAFRTQLSAVKIAETGSHGRAMWRLLDQLITTFDLGEAMRAEGVPAWRRALMRWAVRQADPARATEWGAA
ncbi:MAG: hypothetical protein ACLGHR_10325 [Gammaproteobacteria bacterium]